MFLEPLSLCAISVLEIFPLKVAIIHMGSFFCVFLRLSPDRVSQEGYALNGSFDQTDS